MRKFQLALAVMALALGTLACGVTGGGSDAAKAIETQVSGTLTAIAGQSVGPDETQDAPTVEAPTVTATETVTAGDAAALRVVYLDSGDVWIWEEGIGSTQLTSSGNAEQVLISDDGQVVVYLLRPDPNQSSEVRAVNADGSGDRTLLSSTAVNELHPLNGFVYNDVSSIEFIPGTHQLLMNSRAVAEGPGLIKYNDLHRIDADGGTSTVIREAGNGGDFSIAPDGSRIALVRPDSIGLADPDGSNSLPDLISYEPVITYSEFQYYAQPVWNSDSTAIMVTIPSPDPLADATSGTTYRIDGASGAVSELGIVNGDIYFSQVFTSPSPSPAHDRLGFLRIPPDADDRLVLANPDGSGETTYTTGDLEWRGWSPTGQYFLFSQGDPSNVFLGRPGEAPTALISGFRVQWIDDTTFLYLQGSTGSWTLRLGKVGGAMTDVAAPSGDFVPFDHAPAD